MEELGPWLESQPDTRVFTINMCEMNKSIFDYFKTKDVYADYRKCGYCKKFLEEHRQDILLHKAAKNAFDELHLKELNMYKILIVEDDPALCSLF